MRATIIVIGICFSAVAACATAEKAADPEPAPAGTQNPTDPGNGGTPDAGTTRDSGRTVWPDSGSSTGDGGQTVCAPGDTTAFLPQWKPPTAFHQNQCDANQISGYLSSCLVGGSQSACTTWRSANAACATCLATPETASALGPVILRTNGLVTINISGCIANVTGDTSTTGCAYKEQRALQCVSFACDPYCDTRTQAGLAEYQQCTVNAQSSGGCSTFVSEAQDCRTVTLTGQAAQCANQASFTDYYNFIAPLFCGP